MITQWTPGLKHIIKEYGCYFLSLIHIIQVENRLVLNVKDINDIYDIAYRRRWIGRNCEILNPDKILNTNLIKKKIYQVGTKEDGKTVFWNWVHDEDFDWVLGQYDTTGYAGTHFVLLDKKYDEFFDPMQGEGYTATGMDRFVFYKVFKDE